MLTYILGPSKVYSGAFSTYKYATANKMLYRGGDTSSPISVNAKRLSKPGMGSSYESKDVSKIDR